MIDSCLSDPFQIQHHRQRLTEAAEHWNGMEKDKIVIMLL